MRIGYVGLGAMGRELAVRLAPAHELLVFDLNHEAVAALEKHGATAANSMTEIGEQCDAVFLCLPKSTDVEHVIFDKGGLAAAMRAGSILIDQTSGQPALTRKIAERLARQDIALVDAPVSGGVPLAQAGTITVMASGAAEHLASAEPMLNTLSCNVYHCGDTVGCGQALKAINNTVNTANRLVTLELAAVGRHLGLGLDEMTAAFNSGGARNFITENMLTAILAGRPATNFAMRLMVKDIDQGSDLANSEGMAMPVSEAARALLCTALRIRGEEARLEEVVPFMEQLARVSFMQDTERLPVETAPSGQEAIDMLGVALAACNRIVFEENLHLALSMGMVKERIAAPVLSGSARSEQAERLLAGDTTADASLALRALSTISELGAHFGMPLAITNQVRARMVAGRAREIL